MQRWKRAHLFAGLAGLLLFLLSGQYMHLVHGHLHGMAPAPRLLYRSAHIYLLWSSLLNLVLGCYLVRTPHPAAVWIQRAGSVLILAAPPLLCLGFLLEPAMEGLVRPYSRAAIYLSALGVVMHVFTTLRKEN